MPSNLNLKLLVPGALVGLVGVMIAGGIVGVWALNIMDLSFRTDGRYAEKLQVATPAAQIPKNSYLCPANEKTPWIGCAIQ